jgi:hypothetical protein
MAGLERLVQYRGLHQTDTPLGKALMKSICYLTVRLIPITLVSSSDLSIDDYEHSIP